MCILSSNVINNIIKKHDISNGGFESMHVTDEIQNLSLLFNMSINPQILKDFFIMGNLKKSLTRNKTCDKQLLIECNGLQKKFANINLELSLFAFLFPHGNDAYDGKIPIHEYLKYHMSSLFLPFTLYKPYLLIMYDF
jgi:hypothetical protein